MGVLLPEELLPLMYQDLKSLVLWLGKYLKPTLETVRNLKDSMNDLLARTQDLRCKLVEAVKNKWSPRYEALEWIRKALDYNRRVQMIVDGYIQLRDRHWDRCCPCDAVLLSRQINMEALDILVQVERHCAQGKAYVEEAYGTAAEWRASDPEDLSNFRDLVSQVKRLQRYSEDVFAPPHTVSSSFFLSATAGEGGQFSENCSHGGQNHKQHYTSRRNHWMTLTLTSTSTSTLTSTLSSTNLHQGILEGNFKVRYVAILCQAKEKSSGDESDSDENDETSGDESDAYGKDEDYTADDEDIEPDDVSLQTIEKLQLSAFSKYSGLPRSESKDSTPVMIRVRAPRYTYGRRTPIDLVVLLQVSESMPADKLNQVKQGVLFVLRNLRAQDRLSVVACDNRTHLLLPLTYLSNEGKAQARTRIVDLPAVAGACEVLLTPAMEAVHQILVERVEERPARVMVLADSDGFDGAAVTQGDYPTYTLGVGSEHDQWNMYGVASREHGTYSFDSTTELKSIGAAMALCIGGLTSITAQRVQISIRSEHPDVRILRISSGAYGYDVKENSTLGSIIVDDIYSSEEKNFLVYVNVPKAEAGGFFPRTSKTKLLTVEANYCCPLNNSSEQLHLDPVEVSVERKGHTQASSQAAEVAGEVLRARVLEEVRNIADTMANKVGSTNSGLAGISSDLAGIRDTIKDISEAMEAKRTWDSLSRDLDSMEDSETGLPYMLSWLTSHQRQRAAIQGSISKSGFINFRTTRMQNMIDSVDVAPIDTHHLHQQATEF